MTLPVLLPSWFIPTHPPPAGARRVFVAEDDLQVRILLAERLQADGHDVVPIDSGRSLLDALRRARLANTPPDLLLTDVSMPGMSGLQAVRIMRGWGWQLPVVVLTAFAGEDTVLEAYELGAAAVCSKPVELDDLSLVIAHCLPADHRPGEHGDRGTAPRA